MAKLCLEEQLMARLPTTSVGRVTTCWALTTPPAVRWGPGSRHPPPVSQWTVASHQMSLTGVSATARPRTDTRRRTPAALDIFSGDHRSDTAPPVEYGAKESRGENKLVLCTALTYLVSGVSQSPAVPLDELPWGRWLTEGLTVWVTKLGITVNEVTC